MVGQSVTGFDLAVEICTIRSRRGRTFAALARGKDGSARFSAMLPAGGQTPADHEVLCFETEEIQTDTDPVEGLRAVVATVTQRESALVAVEVLETILGANRERVTLGELQVVGETQVGGGVHVVSDIRSRPDAPRGHGVCITALGSVL